MYVWLCIIFFLAIAAIVWSSRRARTRRALPTRQPSTVDIAFDLLHREDPIPSASDTIATTVDLWIDAFRQGDETGVIELARLYMQGVHPTTRPNKIVGGRICSYVLSSPLFSKGAKLRAREMLQNEMFYEYFDDLAGHETLSDHVLDQLLLSEPEVVTRKIAMVDLPPEPPHNNREYMDLPYFNLDQVDLEQQRHLMQQIEVMRPVRAVGDSQNVHSSTVQKGASIALNRFENEQVPHAQTPIDFESYVRSQKELSDQEKTNALDVHRSLLRDVKHSRYDRSEKEVFDTMWNRVTRDRDDHLMSTFARSLGSAVENGVIVCSTGKIVRMIGSIDGMTDDAPNLRPEWALDSELAQIAVKIRNEQTEGKEDEMIEQFRREATDTYKDLIPKDILEAKIEVFAEGF